MTHPESDLPGGPAERALDERPGGCADFAMGLLLTISEAAVLAMLVLWLALRGLERSHAPVDSGVPSASGSGAETDWASTIAFGALALVVVVLATVLLRGRWYWAGGIQVLVAVALCTLALTSVSRADVDAPPAPAPTWNSPPCRSGGDSDECARSGG
ncbi:DUF6234 family protein [Streptomyces cyaneofuscatus]|uniref:DUF6234 family protein n=1 Tax=Streptomyces TaxID=1883 RepID=UPI000978EF65|nr:MULTISPECIES: DUF6234 family protein [unclassified Streptomyces]ONI55123.1 hypothetical protein STIB_06930 [Streptomyces sp. IB2014 011-1]RDV53951.1 hypothetical protein DDV98_03045 [Streptomyces sp. IB2014 011-12]